MPLNSYSLSHSLTKFKVLEEWEGNQNDTPFVFKVHVSYMENICYDQSSSHCYVSVIIAICELALSKFKYSEVHDSI